MFVAVGLLIGPTVQGDVKYVEKGETLKENLQCMPDDDLNFYLDIQAEHRGRGKEITQMSNIIFQQSYKIELLEKYRSNKTRDIIVGTGIAVSLVFIVKTVVDILR